MEKRTAKKWYSRIFSEIFLAAAAGRIKSALIMRMPIHLMDTMTVNAVSAANKFSSQPAGIWRLRASVRFRLTARSLINAKSQNASVASSIRKR